LGVHSLQAVVQRLAKPA